jgi:predicted esterase
MSWSCIVNGLIILVLLTACAPQRRQMSMTDVDTLSQEYGYSHRVMDGGKFSLLTVSADVTPEQHGPMLRVYIEGDGLAWRTRRHLSSHPTPVNPVSLRLMLADPSPDKLYIARPCQFIQTDFCQSRFWSTDRYHEDVVAAVSAVISNFKQARGYTQVELVGYSGGATVALLFAARRDDVLSVRTVSGNLDPAEFCRLHHVTPLSGSLNPIDFTASLQSIPQLHFVGEQDSVVPIEIFTSYRGYFDDPQLVKSKVVSGMGHREGWVKIWDKLLQQPI